MNPNPPTPHTDEQLQQIIERAQRGTLHVALIALRGGDGIVKSNPLHADDTDQLFGAICRQDIPTLIARIQEQDKEIERLRFELQRRKDRSKWQPNVRHFKGGLYRFECSAIDTRDGSSVVLYTGEDGREWARPENEFFGTVEHEGRVVRRFVDID